MCVLDANGNVLPTPFIESVQLRRYVAVPEKSTSPMHAPRDAQQFSEFVASRRLGGELQQIPADEFDFYQFQAHHTDPLEISAEALAALGPDGFRRRLQRNVLASCFQCHSQRGIYSVRSYSRIEGHTPWLKTPVFVEAGPERQAVTAMAWKRGRYDFGLLQGLWRR
jgi:hypothetical protein